MQNSSKILKIINEEVSSNLDGKFARLWIGGIKESGIRAFYTSSIIKNSNEKKSALIFTSNPDQDKFATDKLSTLFSSVC